MANRQMDGVGGGGNQMPNPKGGKKSKDLIEDMKLLTSLYIEPEFITEGSQQLLCEYYKDFIQTLLLKVRMKQQLKKNPSPDDYKSMILSIIQNDDKVLYKSVKTQLLDLRYRIHDEANKNKEDEMKLDDGEKKTENKDKVKDDDEDNDDNYDDDSY